MKAPTEVISMGDSKFCCVDDFPVLIPYKDLVKLVEVAKNLEQFEMRLSRTDEKLGALNGLYSELLQKVRELDNLI